ncbi:MAG: translation initiation factor IF-2 [Candidatus Omnitrophica bacterium]|nr:translation initiation factor IF-2 [Candidatus Omnitrophota bacterium]
MIKKPKTKSVKPKKDIAKSAVSEKAKAKKPAAKTVSSKKKPVVKKSVVPVEKPIDPIIVKKAEPAAVKPVVTAKPVAAAKPILSPKPVVPVKPAAVVKPVETVKPAVSVKPAVKIEEKIAQPVAKVPEIKKPDEKIEAVIAKTAEPVKLPEEPKKRILEIEPPISLKDLAAKIGVKPNELIVNLMAKNIFATINQSLGEEMLKDVLRGYDIELKRPAKLEDQVVKEHRELEEKQDIKHLALRSPVVTFMGHVDHGKTSLLDFIRKTHVADKEKGGITQHIGAYEVKVKNGSVTFLDTPGHEAFTAMRARGANATDIVVLVVAADDGVMPQTKEALDHARAAGVQIVVAINKCDLPGANVEKIKGQLAQLGLTPEDWGGKTITMPVSAKTGEGVETLLEMLLLEAELLELKANPGLRARGVVIEGKLSSGQGPVATVLVKNGTLKLGDMVLTGMHYGRIKAMMDHTGSRINEAPPSKPVTILGLSGVPMAGDEFFVVKDEKKARVLSLLKQDEARSKKLKMSQRVTLEDFYKQMKEGVAKELAIVMKGDVQGSIEALKKSLVDLGTKDVKIDIVHADVGTINESDIMLAVVSNAVVLGFNVKIDEGAQELAAKEGIEIKLYGIIYEAIQDVIAAMEGLLEPVLKEIFVARAQVKQVFKVTKAGTIAGSIVVKGKMVRTGVAKLIRDKKVVYEGKISSLKRFKDDVRDVNEGVECGIGLDRHDDVRAGDLIEVYSIEKVARRLDSKK